MGKRMGLAHRYSLVVACFLCLLLFLSLFSARGLFSLYRLYRTQQHLNAQIVELKAKNAVLRHEVSSWQEDLGRIERVARDELGLVKPGEIVYQF